jgi:acetoacetyl-CoA synthetase
MATFEERRPLVARAPEHIGITQLSAFIRFCEQQTGKHFPDYQRFERYCIEHYPDFWHHFLLWSDMAFTGAPSPAIAGQSCESAHFFPHLSLNYVDNLLRVDEQRFVPNRPALTAVHHDRAAERWTREQLRERVGALATGLATLGIKTSDPVALLASNNAESIVGTLAAAALGCPVSTAAPDMGSDALLSRLKQAEPALLMTDLSHPEASTERQHHERLVEVVRALPSLRAILLLRNGVRPDGIGIPVYCASTMMSVVKPPPVAWPQLPFNHPLFLLFTSGTTGVPKGLVHGAGGTLIEHLKEHRLHCDLGPADKLFFHTSTGWMMWNWQLSALASGVELVLYDGPLTSADRLWRIVAEERVTVFGTSPAYLQLCEREYGSKHLDSDFGALRAILSTGSILYPRHQTWVWNCVKPLPVQPISGGTDIIGCFVLSNPNLPVYGTECQCRSLALDVRALKPADARADDAVGELICANPFPSRPLRLLQDPEGKRFHQAYFAEHPGVWTHGDLIEFTAEGSARMHGRCDGVLNIRGIRIGPAEIYRILHDFPEITEAMAIEQRAEQEPGGTRLVLLVVLQQGQTLDDALVGRIKRELGKRGSSAHVPAFVIAVNELPTTFSGKRSERSARDALNGAPVTNRGALRNPECLEQLNEYAVATQGPTRCSKTDSKPQAFPTADDLLMKQCLRDIWERALKVTPIDDDDNYFELGGESIKALQIAAEIKRITGRDVPLSMLIEAPTIKLLTASIAHSNRSPRRSLVLLRQGSDVSAPPLFIVHGIGGSAMELLPLSRALQTTRSIYGLQARGFYPDEKPLERIEDMAEVYLEAIRALQPQGPYLLAGYSFGGLVGFEMARSLAASGQTVQQLLLLDTTTAEDRWPALAWVEYFVRRLRHNGRRLRTMSARELAPYSLSLWRAFHHRLKGRRIHDELQGSLPVDADDNPLPRFVHHIRRAHFYAIDAYRPMPADLRITVFRSDLQKSHLCDPAQVWRPLARTVTVLDVPGDHWSMIRPPHLGVLAEHLSPCLCVQKTIRVSEESVAVVS